MIPKKIHYCWLSNDPIPSKLQNCIDSWKKHLPDYELIKWDLNRFPLDKCVWVRQAYEHKKYAFAADYIRLYALYNYGGIYLDMDVEVIKPFDDLLCLKDMVCFENSNDGRLEIATFGVEKGSKWVYDCLEYYRERRFVKKNGSFDTCVLPVIIKQTLLKNEYTLIPINSIKEAKNVSRKQIPVFPFDYFSPKAYGTGKIERSNNTFSIHHFAGTWLPWYAHLEKKITNMLGLTYHDILRHIIHILKGKRYK